MTQEEMIERVVDVDTRARSNTRRIEKIETKQEELNDLVTSVAVIAQKQVQMETNIEEIRTDVRTLIGKPAKRWDSIVDTIYKVIITAAVSALLLKLGIGG